VCSTAEMTLAVGALMTRTDDRQAGPRFEQLPIHLRRAPHEERIRVAQLREQALARGADELHDLVPGLA